MDVSQASYMFKIEVCLFITVKSLSLKSSHLTDCQLHCPLLRPKSMEASLTFCSRPMSSETTSHLALCEFPHWARWCPHLQHCSGLPACPSSSICPPLVLSQHNSQSDPLKYKEIIPFLCSKPLMPSCFTQSKPLSSYHGAKTFYDLASLRFSHCDHLLPPFPYSLSSDYTGLHPVPRTCQVGCFLRASVSFFFAQKLFPHI